MFSKIINQDINLTDIDLLADFVPAKMFLDARFENYFPNQNFPSQQKTSEDLKSFIHNINVKSEKKSFFSFKKQKTNQKLGVYLDGSYGVGKTHLLAAAWHEAKISKIYGTFLQYTSLIGALGFQKTVTLLQSKKLLCIDEFELDDPGDTVMISRLLRQLTDLGTKVVVTSNTLPDSLGEGRFAAQDFLREIQAISNIFQINRIDGPDYRAKTNQEIDTKKFYKTLPEVEILNNNFENIFYDDFEELLNYLKSIHQIKYSQLLKTANLLIWKNVKPILDQADALRFVAFVDRMYDHEITLMIISDDKFEIFLPEHVAGGFRKKYLRALSRINAMLEAAKI